MTHVFTVYTGHTTINHNHILLLLLSCYVTAKLFNKLLGTF